MQIVGRTPMRIEALVCLFVATLLAAAMFAALVVAPQEETMGDAQRIVYVHVAVAWFGLMGLAVAATAGLMGLVRRNIAWDDWAQAAAEIGWLCATLTLVSGSLWAHEVWNTWWTWDPRLTTSLILWTIYAGYFLARAGIDDRRRRARIGAILSIIGVLDVPLVVMATRWFRGMHPVSPEMEPAMRVALLVTTLAFTALFVCLFVIRRRQIELARRIDA